MEQNIHQIEKKGVDVELFGAVGDGITDDSLAIQNAINYARETNINIVNFDSKTYICNNYYFIEIKCQICFTNVKWN